MPTKIGRLTRNFSFYPFSCHPESRRTSGKDEATSQDFHRNLKQVYRRRFTLIFLFLIVVFKKNSKLRFRIPVYKNKKCFLYPFILLGNFNKKIQIFSKFRNILGNKQLYQITVNS